MSKKISWISILGIVISAIFIYTTISNNTDNSSLFINTMGIVLIFGCLIGAMSLAYGGFCIKEILKEVYGVFFVPIDVNNKTVIKKIISLAELSKTDGSSGLDASLDKIENKKSFFYYGLELVTFGYQGEELKKLLANHLAVNFEKSNRISQVFTNLSVLSPGLGMIGTVIGLILMLDGLGGDPSDLGKGLSVALVTTLYGVILSNLLFKPIAIKIKERAYLVKMSREIIAEGFVLLSEKNPSLYVQDMLNSYIDISSHVDILRDQKVK